jgi:hypothetical protein
LHELPAATTHLTIADCSGKACPRNAAHGHEPRIWISFFTKEFALSSIEHLSTGPHTVALVSLGYGGAGIDYRCCRGTCTPYVNADDFERILSETNHLFHTDCGPEQFEAAFVLDKRPAIDRHGARCAINSPMLDATLPEGQESPLRTDLESLALMAPGLGGEFQVLAAKKLIKPSWRGLDFISLTAYVDHWRRLPAGLSRRTE